MGLFFLSREISRILSASITTSLAIFKHDFLRMGYYLAAIAALYVVMSVRPSVCGQRASRTVPKFYR